MNSHKTLASSMNRQEVEGAAPYQILGSVAADDLDGNRLRAQDAYFPAKFEDNRDIEKESKIALKTQLDQNTWGTRTLDNDTVDYLYDKAKQQEMRQFDAWYANVFDHRDPAQLKLSREINPGWFDRRVKAVEQSLDFQKKIAKMQLLGIRNQEDVLTAYAFATGRVDPSLYATNFMNPAAQVEAVRQKQYISGMFAPRLFDAYRQIPSQIVNTGPLNQRTGAGGAAVPAISGNAFALSLEELTNRMTGTGNQNIAPGFLNNTADQNFFGAANRAATQPSVYARRAAAPAPAPVNPGTGAAQRPGGT
jgi:hypothetical protein